MHGYQRRLSLIALGLLIFGVLTGGRSAAQGNATAVLQEVNRFRTNAGLPAWGSNTALAAAAQEQANWMAATNQYLHNHNGSTPHTRAAAAGFVGYVSEIIVGGWELTPSGALQWWLNSPVHYNIVVSQNYSMAGAGYAVSGNQHYFVIVVGRPDNNVDQNVARRQVAPAPIRVVPIIVAEPADDGSVTHIVEEGQTAWALAARYGERYDVDLNRLLWLNGLEENDFVRPGDSLLIVPPDDWTPPPTPTPQTTVRVREGQTLWTIAALNNIALEDLLWLNNLTPDALIQPGDVLTVRLLPGQVRPTFTPTPSPTPVRAVTVRDGDSLWSIAARHDLSLNELLAFNQLPDNAVIYPGDTLWVMAPPTATPTPTVTPTPVPATTPSPAPAAAEPADAGGAVEVEPASVQVASVVTVAPSPTVPAAAVASNGDSAARTGSSAVDVLLLGFGALCLVGAAVFLTRR